MPDMGDQTTDLNMTAANATVTTAVGTADTDGELSERSFSAADVDRIVRERLARAKTQPPADYEDLKAKAAKFDETEAASKTELEKAVERAETAERERLAAIETANRRMIQAAVLTEAAAQQAIKPEHLHRLLDTESLTVEADGTVTGAKEAVESFLKANPEYVTRAAGSADQGARGGGVKQLAEADLKSMTAEQIVAARREGRLTGLGVGS